MDRPIVLPVIRGNKKIEKLSLPSIGASTPDDETTVLGVQGGAVKRFPVAGLGGVTLTFKQSGAGAVARTAQSKLSERISVKDFGAAGDGVTDDYAALAKALARAAEIGAVLEGVTGETYRITQGLVIDADRSVFNLNRATLVADFATGWAVSVGDGVALRQGSGIRNGVVTTTRPETTLNGVRYRYNIRHATLPENLRISQFKGIGFSLDGMNWNVQSLHGLHVHNCGTNVRLGDNCNAINFVDATIMDADAYNVSMDGVNSVNFFGGIIQGAGTAGVRLVADTNACIGVGFWGTYFEDNGANHVLATGARGVTIGGAYVQSQGMTGDSFKFTDCDGVHIAPNAPANVAPNALVNLDATCTRVQIAPQHVTTPSDEAISGDLTGIAGNALSVRDVTTRPAVGNLQRGTLRMFLVGEREVPFVGVRTDASGSRRWEPFGFGPRKVAGAGASASQALNLNNGNVFDYTITQATTITTPTQPVIDGEEIVVMLKQNSTGGWPVSWAAAFKTDLAPIGTSDQFAAVTFRWSATRSAWIQTGKLGWTS